MNPMILGWLSLAVQYGPQIVNLIKAGAPIGEAVAEHAPALWAAIKKFAPDQGHAEIAATKIFVPHMMTADQERRWMDFASRTTDGGS